MKNNFFFLIFFFGGGGKRMRLGLCLGKERRMGVFIVELPEDAVNASFFVYPFG